MFKVFNYIFFGNIRHKGFFRLIILGYIASIFLSYLIFSSIIEDQKKSGLFNLGIAHDSVKSYVKYSGFWAAEKCDLLVNEKYPKDIIKYFYWLDPFAKTNKSSLQYFAENNADSIRRIDELNDTKYEELINEIQNSNKNINLLTRRSCKAILLDYHTATHLMLVGMREYSNPLLRYFFGIDASLKPFYPILIFLVFIHLSKWIVLGFKKRSF